MPTTGPILDDYEIQRLIQIELDSLRANKDHIPVVLKEAYEALKGNWTNFKSIVVMKVNKRVKEKLDKTDLWGPDDIIKPEILKFVDQAVGDSFDEFFTPVI